MPLRFPILVCLLLQLAVYPYRGVAESRGAEVDRADPAIVYGRLENGFRYAIRRQPVPAGRISMQLFVDAGSADETGKELGYAHFVEHMAFAGTRDFPGDGVIRTLQRYGLAFGSEINAATGRTYTIYKLSRVPTETSGAVETALQVMRNYADGVLFDPDAVERERGVILSEGRVRAGRVSYWWDRGLGFLPPFDATLTLSELEALFPRSAWSRSQLGPRRSIARAKPEALRKFHARWYRPERMVLAVAGDLDPAQIEALIRPVFNELRGIGPEPTRVRPGLEVRKEAVSVAVVDDPDSPAVHVSLAGARMLAPGAKTMREHVAEAVTMHLIEQRLCATLKIGALVEGEQSEELAGLDVAVLRVRTTPENWIKAAVGLETELRRALLHGFGAEEVAEAGEWYRRSVRWHESDAANRTSEEVAAALAHATARGLGFPDPAEERAAAERVLAELTAQECRDAVRRLWPAGSTTLLGAGPLGGRSAARTTLREAVKEARMKLPEPYAAKEALAVVLPGDSGITGAVANREKNEALDCWLLQFDNGVRLNFKHTKFEKGRVRVRIAFGHGLLGTEPGKEGLAFGIAALFHGRIPGVSAQQERELRERGEITTSFGFGADRLGFSAESNRNGLNTVMRLFAARFIAPEFPAGGEAAARAFIESQFVRFESTAPGVAEDCIREYMYARHHALTRPRKEDVQRLSFDDMRAWIEPQLRDSPIEITVVGDIELDEVVEVVSRTFGAMPLRSTVDSLADRRLFTPGPTPTRQEIRFEGKREVGSLVLAWRLPDVVGQADDCRMRVLSAVLEDRMRVRLRREMGRTYSPSVGLLAERALAPAMLILRCRVETAPRDLERLGVAANAVAAEIVNGGVTEDELERARVPLIRHATENRSSNNWWLSALDEAQTKQQYLEEQGEQARLYREVGLAELNELARLLFSPDRRCEFLVRPK